MSDVPLQLPGLTNYNNPRQGFADRIFAMSDDAFIKESAHYIWLSAYASNNPRSDYHWMTDACHDEATRRGKPGLYQTAWESVART